MFVDNNKSWSCLFGGRVFSGYGADSLDVRMVWCYW